MRGEGLRRRHDIPPIPRPPAAVHSPLATSIAVTRQAAQRARANLRRRAAPSAIARTSSSDETQPSGMLLHALTSSSTPSWSHAAEAAAEAAR